MEKLEENASLPEKLPLYDFNSDKESDREQTEIKDLKDVGKPEREEWGRGLDFILSLLGFAVGLGNLWRFPYLCVRNGGGAFLIPFLFFLITCGLPIFFLEVSLGQFMGKGISHVWEICPLFKGIGFGMIITLSFISVYYNTIIAWTLYYMANTLQAVVPWSQCDGWWTTESCFRQGQDDGNGPTNSSVLQLNRTMLNIFNSTAHRHYGMVNSSNPSLKPMTSTEQFWQYNVLRISSGIDDVGYPSWYMAVSMIVAWILVFLCIFKGVKSIGKVVYVTALLPYVLLFIILIRGVTLPGAVDGIILFLKPDLEKMMNIQVWVEAALQVFYSLGPGWGPLIAMASFCKFNENALRTSIIITLVGEGTSIFSGFVVFTVLGFMANELGVPVEEVVKSGPGLGFVAYPQALARLPLPQFWSFLFFFMLMMVGLDSQFAPVEAVITAITDSFPKLQRRRILVTAVVCVVMGLMGIPFICQGGIYSFQLVDWYVTSFGVPLFCLLECIMIGWIYGSFRMSQFYYENGLDEGQYRKKRWVCPANTVCGAERFSNDIKLMLGRGVPFVIRFCWCILSPLILLICLIFTIATYKPPSYGDYQYPTYGNVIGWIMALLPVIPVVLVPLFILYKTKGSTLAKKLRSSTEPTEHWRPHPGECPVCYDDVKFSYHGYNVKERIKLNLTGRG